MKESEIRPQQLFNEYLTLAREDTERMAARQADFVSALCPACSGSATAEAFEKLGFRYATCGDCGTLYNTPRPGPALIDDFYQHGRSVEFWSERFFRETADARREKMFRPRAQLVADLVRRGAAGGAVFADIGSGYGIFLEEVRALSLFKDVVGIEPGPRLADECRKKGFPVVQKRVEDVVSGEVAADFASAFEVIEHVFDPLAFLRGARSVLKAGGKLLLTTLTVDGFDIQVLWDRSKSVHPPHHLNLLSLRGFERLFARAGFKIVDMSTPGRLDVDIVANAVSEQPDLPIPRFAAKLLEKDSEARQRFQEFLSANHLSSHVRIVAEAA